MHHLHEIEYKVLPQWQQQVEQYGTINRSVSVVIIYLLTFLLVT